MKLGQRREGFSGKLGFVLAAAGSAVGLGNIWRFPYLTAKYGGGIFLLTYLLLVLSFGYALLISEIGIGRMTRRSPIGAFRKLCRKKSSFLGSIRIGGWINAIVPMLIVPYYVVIGGWVTKYMVALAVNPAASFHKDRMVTAGGKTLTASAAYFQGFITSWQESLIYFLLFLLITAVVVAAGVKKGIERFNKVLMPMLVILILGICVYCIFLPNSGAGFRYYLMPDLSVQIRVECFRRPLLFGEIPEVAVSAFFIPVLLMGIVETEAHAVFFSGLGEFFQRIAAEGGRLDDIVIVPARIEHGETVVMLAGDDHVFHSGFRCGAHPAVGIEIRRVEIRRQFPVFRSRDAEFAHQPFGYPRCFQVLPSAARGGIEPPVDEHSES